MQFRKTVFTLILGLSAISLLIVWDIHTLRLHSGYASGVLEVRRYSGEMGAFRVLFSKARDANEANALLPARSHLPDIPQADVAVDGDQTPSVEDEEEGDVREDEERARAKEFASMRFKPLTQAPNADEELAELEEVFITDDEKPSQKSISSSPSRDLQQHDDTSSPDLIANHQSPATFDPKLAFDINSFKPVSNFQQQKTTVDAIKELLSYNEVESTEALWNMSKNQELLDSPEYSKWQQKNKNKTSDRQFFVRSSMTWPLPQFTRPDILKYQWVEDLKKYLQGINEWRQISVVTANQEHEEVVLNWLISAITIGKLSLRNILVLSLSERLHGFLVSKKMNSIHIPPTSVINSGGLRHINTAFNQIHIVRLTLFRLMTHWAYDVVMYDSDAVILKDPQPLFDANAGMELVGSSGKGPPSIGHEWGRTICTGVLLMRSSPDLEKWWEKMSQVARLPFTDQGLVNTALKALNVRWDLVSPLYVDRDMRGTCPHTKLKAIVLSEEKICRYSCDSHKRDKYYVWHKPAIKRNRTVENKKQRARDGGAWFLKEDWIQVSKMNSLTGVTWLLAISHND